MEFGITPKKTTNMSASFGGASSEKIENMRWQRPVMRPGVESRCATRLVGGGQPDLATWCLRVAGCGEKKSESWKVDEKKNLRLEVGCAAL